MIQYIRQFVITISAIFDVPAFVKENKLWKGFRDHKLVVISLLIFGALFSWHLLSLILNWWRQLEVHNPLEAGLQATILVKDLAVGGYQFMFAGAYKYVVLIVMEMLIYHLTLRTHEILDGRKEQLTPGRFLQAQIRMIKVSIFSFAMELIVSIVLKTLLSILGFEALKGVLLFATQCFFLGFVMIDNYNEVHHLKIRDSYRHTLKYSGAAIAIGLVLYILILVPMIGPFIGPVVGAIAATMVMHELEGPAVAHQDLSSGTL